MAQFGEKIWFRKIGEDGVTSFASRMTQGIFVGHHDRTGAALCITKNGIVRGKSWTRQTLSDAWDATNWDGLCGIPWEMVAPELKLAKKVTADKEGAGPPLPRIVVERTPEVQPRRFYVLSADIEAHGHRGGCLGCAALASHGRATEPHDDACRERIRTIIEITLTGKARPPKLIATILKALREQLKENDQLDAVEEIAGPVLEIPLEYDQILKGGRFWDDVNGGDLPEDLVLAARREEIDRVHSEGVYEIVPTQECKDAGMKPLDFICVDTDKSVDPTRKRIRSRLCVREYKTKSQLFSAMPPLEAVKVLVSIMMSVSLSNKGKPLKLRHYDVRRAHFQGTARRVIHTALLAEDRQKYGEDKVGGLAKSTYGTQDASHIWQLDYVNLICGELGDFRRGKHSSALFHNPNEDVRMAVHGDDCVFVRR